MTHETPSSTPGNLTEAVEKLKIAFWASLANANAVSGMVDYDSMDMMIEAAWQGFEEPATAALTSLPTRDTAIEEAARQLKCASCGTAVVWEHGEVPETMTCACTAVCWEIGEGQMPWEDGYENSAVYVTRTLSTPTSGEASAPPPLSEDGR